MLQLTEMGAVMTHSWERPDPALSIRLENKAPQRDRIHF